MLLPGARGRVVVAVRGPTPRSAMRGGESGRGRPTGCRRLGAPVGAHRVGSSASSLHRGFRRRPLHSALQVCRPTRKRPGFHSPSRVTPNLSQWRPRLGMANGSDGGARIGTGSRGRPTRSSSRTRDRARSEGRRASRCGRSRVPVGMSSGHGDRPRASTDARVDGDREAAHRMLRLLHTADVHLGARHADLGDAAAAQRERQFAAFEASVDLALSEKVDLFLVAGDLFDSNVQPQPLRGARRRGARPPRRRRGSAPSSSRARTTSTTASRSTAPTTSRRWPATPAAGRADRRADAGPPVDPPRRPRRRRPRARASPRSAPRTARSATSPRSRRPRRPGRSACSTPRSRSRAARTATTS